MTIAERIEQLERKAERLELLEQFAARVCAELGISIDELAGVDLASLDQPKPEAVEPEPAPVEQVDLGEVIDLDAVDLEHVTETCGNGSAYDAIPYPDVDGAIHAEAVKRGFVDPESLAVMLADEYWSAEDLEHDIKQRLAGDGWEVLDETSIYVAPDFGALLDEVQDLRNIARDALPSYREYAAAELQRRRDAGKKYKAPYKRRVKSIDWAAAEREPVYQVGVGS